MEMSGTDDDWNNGEKKLKNAVFDKWRALFN